MKIALCSDAPSPVNAFVQHFLEDRGHTCQLFGAFETGQETCWAGAGRAAAQAVRQGICDEGVFLCWSGTGICMAANKVRGVRAALCTDAETAKAARIWNHANVLSLSHRLLTNDLASEILTAWLETPWEGRGTASVTALQAIDSSSVSP